MKNRLLALAAVVFLPLAGVAGGCSTTDTPDEAGEREQAVVAGDAAIGDGSFDTGVGDAPFDAPLMDASSDTSPSDASADTSPGDAAPGDSSITDAGLDGPPENDTDPDETCSTCEGCADAAVNPSCTVCSDDSIDQWLDQYLDAGTDSGATGSAQSGGARTEAAMTPAQKDALNKCFNISNIIKYDTTRFNCQHYSYYTYKCLNRFGFGASMASIFCKNCSNPDYKNGQIGHRIIGVTIPGTPDQCCMMESETPYPDAKRLCVNAPCNWTDLMNQANTMYCTGKPSYWFPGDTRKKDCVVSSAKWDNSAPETTCTAGDLSCLVDSGIVPPFKPCKDRVGQNECMGKPWPKPNSSCAWIGSPPNQYCGDP